MRVAFKAGVIDALHGFVVFEEFRQRQRVRAMAFHTQIERFKPL